MTPLAEVALVISGGPGCGGGGGGGGAGAAAILIARDCVPVPPAFVAEIVALNVPAALGVPEMSPLAVFTPSPGGKPLAPKLVGELLAVIW